MVGNNKAASGRGHRGGRPTGADARVGGDVEERRGGKGLRIIRALELWDAVAVGVGGGDEEVDNRVPLNKHTLARGQGQRRLDANNGNSGARPPRGGGRVVHRDAVL